MNGRPENTLPPKTPTNDFKVRALDADGKSCVFLYSDIQNESYSEGDIKDFLVGNTIYKKRYTGGEWVETGIEWEI